MLPLCQKIRTSLEKFYWNHIKPLNYLRRINKLPLYYLVFSFRNMVHLLIYFTIISFHMFSNSLRRDDIIIETVFFTDLLLKLFVNLLNYFS